MTTVPSPNTSLSSVTGSTLPPPLIQFANGAGAADVARPREPGQCARTVPAPFLVRERKPHKGSQAGTDASVGPRSHPELVREIVEVLGHDVERAVGFSLASAWTALSRPPDMAGAHPKFLGRRQVAAVRGAHHDLLGLEIERFASCEVNLRLRLIPLGDLGTEDCVPREIVAPRYIGHQRNVAIRARCHQEPLVQSRKGWTDIGPSVEFVPGKVKLRKRWLLELLQLEARTEAVKIFAMQNIQLDERPPPAAHFLHARPVFFAPGLREGEPIEIIAHRPQNSLGFACNAVAPIHDR